MFQFYLKLILGIFVNWLVRFSRNCFLFSLGAPSAGIVIKAKACSKPWEAAPSCGTSAALSEDVSFETSGSFDYSY